MRKNSIMFGLFVSLLGSTLLAQGPAQPGTATPAPAGPPTPAPAPQPPIVLNGLGETVLSPRIRDITELHNSMPHKLVGIGVGILAPLACVGMAWNSDPSHWLLLLGAALALIGLYSEEDLLVKVGQALPIS